MDYRDPDWVAERLGIERNTVYRFLQEGTIPAIQLGRKWLVSERRLEAWLVAETDRQTRQRRETAQSSETSIRRMGRMGNFTADAREALRRAHAEARAASHDQLDPLHLLLGLAEDGKSAAGRALRLIGVGTEAIRHAIHESLQPGTDPPARRLPRNPKAKRSLRLAARMALREGNDNPLSPIGTDHLLTGVFLTRNAPAHELLVRNNVTRQRLRKALKQKGEAP
jgi:excisionase family DNA binding protein